MAKIVQNDLAPSGTNRYSFAGLDDVAGIELSGTKGFETSNREALANAEAHPWLTVKYEKAESVEPSFRNSLDPSKDYLSAENSEAFNAEAIQRDRIVFEDIQPLAVDSGLDQDEPVVVEGVAQTLAADDTTDTPKRSKRTASQED